MAHFLSEYGIFFAKTLTLVVALFVIVGFFAALVSKGKQKEKIKIRKLNEKYDNMRKILNNAIFTKKELKQHQKQEKKKQQEKQKAEKKQSTETAKKRIFVLSFKGDLRASAVENFREEITSVLKVATVKDEVVVKIESGGGMVHQYGLAASQMQRIRDRQIPLIASIDKVAASGGYLMACVADRIFSAPFAVLGSIGVIAQLPNFNRLLKKHNIDFEQITSGEYKRTLSLFGENTEKGRKKFKEEIEEVHNLFKNFVSEHRSTINIEQLATGEHWLGKKALELGLVDKLITSDDYLLGASENADIYEISYIIKKKMPEKLAHAVQHGVEKALVS